MGKNMTAGNKLTGIVLSILLLMVSTELTADNTSDKSQSSKTGVNKQELVKLDTGKLKFDYRPPKRGAPAVRVGGGTRGTGDQLLELVVFAPDHTGLTTKEQPTLYWYTSEPVSSSLELTMINDTKIEPELEKVIKTSGAAGIQSIKLSDTQIKLEPGIEYRWFVSVLAEKGQRSNDIVASGTIQRIIPEGDLHKAITAADESGLVEVYAQQGIWYDAIDSLSEMFRKSPGNSLLIEQYATLLDQVGLHSASAHIRNGNGKAK